MALGRVDHRIDGHDQIRAGEAFDGPADHKGVGVAEQLDERGVNPGLLRAGQRTDQRANGRRSFGPYLPHFMLQQRQEALHGGFAFRNTQDPNRMHDEIGVLLRFEILGDLRHHAGLRLLFEHFEDGRPDVRLGIGKQIDQRGGRFGASDVLKPAKPDLADHRIGVAEERQQEGCIGGGCPFDQLLGGLLAPARIGVGQAQQSARPTQRERVAGQQPISEHPQPPQVVVGFGLGQSLRDLGQEGPADRGQPGGRGQGLEVGSPQKSIDLGTGLGQLLVGKRFRLRSRLVRLIGFTGAVGRVIGLRRFVDPFVEPGQSLAAERVRLPRVRVSDRGLPPSKHLNRRQSRRQPTFMKRLDHGPPRHLGIGHQPADRRLADRRVAIVKLLHQANHVRQTGRVGPEQDVVGSSQGRFVMRSEPVGELFGRPSTHVRSNRPSGGRPNQQRRNSPGLQLSDVARARGHVDVDQRPAGQLGLHGILVHRFPQRPARRTPLGQQAYQDGLPLGLGTTVRRVEIGHPEELAVGAPGDGSRVFAGRLPIRRHNKARQVRLNRLDRLDIDRLPIDPGCDGRRLGRARDADRQ